MCGSGLREDENTSKISEFSVTDDVSEHYNKLNKNLLKTF